MNEQSRTTPTPIKRKTATVDQMFAVGDLLVAHCRKTDTGLAEYEPDWDDARIASEVGCVRASVARIRKARVGEVRTVSASKVRLEAIETEIRTASSHIKAHNEVITDINTRLKHLETDFAATKFTGKKEA